MPDKQIVLPKIESRENQRIKAAAKVRDGRDRDRMFVEGVRLCEEALRSSVAVEAAFVSDEALTKPRIRKIVEGLQLLSVPIFETRASVLRTLADTVTPQGIVMVAERPASLKLNYAAAPIAYLWQINDPSNLGAVIRTAEAAGIGGLMLSPNSVSPYSVKSLRASMGSAFRLPVMENVDPRAALKLAEENGLEPLATRFDRAVEHFAIDWKRPYLIFFGSEGHGLNDAVFGEIAAGVRIPMQNDVESLNLAVSAGIIFFEALRHRVSLKNY